MSASPPRADMLRVGINVCKVPEAEVRFSLNPAVGLQKGNPELDRRLLRLERRGRVKSHQE